MGPAGDGRRFQIPVYLAEIDPDAVEVQLFADAQGDRASVCQPMERGAELAGTLNGYLYEAGVPGGRPPEHYAPRVVPRRLEASVPLEASQILCWLAR